MRTILSFCLMSLVTICACADEMEKPWDPHPRVKEYSWQSTAAWKQLHEDFLKRAKEGNIDLLFLGDSITQGWAGAPEVWKANFADKKPANFGIGGDTTQNVLWRITKGGELEGLQPKVVVLMIGTNNFGLRNDTPEDVAKGVEAIVKAIQEKLPKTKILLLGMFPRDAKPNTDFRKRILKANELISKLGNDKSIRYMDIGEKFLDKEGNLPKDVMPDFLHLSAKGYTIWADAIRTDLEAMLKE